MHVALLAMDGPDSGSAVLPFAWTGVSLHARGATALRVRIAPDAKDRITVDVADTAGQPVLHVGSLVSRPVSDEQLKAARGTGAGSLYRIEWNPLDAKTGGAAPSRVNWADLEQGGDVPDVVVLDCAAVADQVRSTVGTPAELRAVSEHVLTVLQQWLADDRFAGARLAVVTRSAVATAEGADVDVLQAPLWGMVRAAQAENPGQFVLVDTDADTGGEPGRTASLAAEAAVLGEPETALRGGHVLIPRLVRGAPLDPESAGPTPWDGENTFLVTGGTGGLGALVARHLVERHGVRHLVLVSRSGPSAPGAEELRADLEDMGAHVATVACDVSDRAGLAAVLDAIPDAHPLKGVVHVASRSRTTPSSGR